MVRLGEVWLPIEPIGRSPRQAALVVLLTALALTLPALATGCDPAENPLTVRNALSQIVTVKVFDEGGVHARIAKKGDDLAQDAVEFLPGEEAAVLIARVAGEANYTIVIEGPDNEELLRRTLTREELDQQQWNLIITEQGIQ